MFRKCISYLVIYSLLWSNCVWAMKGEGSSSDSDSEGKSSLRYRAIYVKQTEPKEEGLDKTHLESILSEEQTHGPNFEQQRISELDASKSLASGIPATDLEDEVSSSLRNNQEKTEIRENLHLGANPVIDDSPESDPPSSPTQRAEIQEAIALSSQEDQNQGHEQTQPTLSSSPSVQPNIEASSPRTTETGMGHAHITYQDDVVIDEGPTSSSSESLSKPDIEMGVPPSEGQDANKEALSSPRSTQEKAELKEEDSHIDRTSSHEDSHKSDPLSNPTENAEIKEETSHPSQGDQNQDQDRDQAQPQPSSAPSDIESLEDHSPRAAEEGTGQDQSTAKVHTVIEEGSSPSSDESSDEGDIEMGAPPAEEHDVNNEEHPRIGSINFGDYEDLERAPLLGDKAKYKTLGLAQKYLEDAGISLQALTSEQMTALNEILAIEGTWKNPFVWSNLQSQISRLWFALFTKKSAVNGEKSDSGSSRLWLHGGPLPLNSESDIKKNIIRKAFSGAFEEGTIESLHAFLTALLGYQIYQAANSQGFSLNFKHIFEFYEGADEISYVAMLRALHNHPTLFAVGAFPFAFAFLKALWGFSQISHPTEEDVQKSIKKLKDTSTKWDIKIVNGLYIVPILSLFLEFPFLSYLFWHPIKNNIPSLTHLILWDGRLPSHAREEAFSAIIDLAQQRAGLSQMAALESLYKIAHGFHTSDLHLRPQDKEELLKIKLRAFCVLKDMYKDLPFSLNKILTGVLLWEMGQSPSWVISLGEPVIKALRAVLYGYTLYSLGQVLYYYITCPDKYLNYFTWLDQVTNYPSNYSQACFDEQVRVFNTLPGQPASTLVSNLTKYNFTGPYNLDLSNKGIEGPVIAEIVEGFQRAGIILNSLNMSGNIITNSSDITRILAALPPEIINLDMSNIYSDRAYHRPYTSDLSGLRHLTGLQCLNLLNTMGIVDAHILGKALQNLPHLHELKFTQAFYLLPESNSVAPIAQAIKPSFSILDLSNTYANYSGKSALGKALAQNTNFQELYLAGTLGQYQPEIPTLQSETNIALAQGLAAQRNLLLLDISSNLLGYGCDYNLTTLLESLPASLIYLDISNNYIGQSDNEETHALARAIEKMSYLTAFKAGGESIMNRLGNVPTLLKSLQKKENLAILDLSYNNLTKTSGVQELLETVPSLQYLDLSHNQLTNGSNLAPALSKLHALETLYLGGNPFTTTERITIGNVTSFLAFPPFPLDEDLTFTKYYLESLPSTTQSLNFSGLISTNSSSLQIILPQIRELFPNLAALDLSNIYFNNEDKNEVTETIKALITYLPQFPHLKFLRLSNFGYIAIEDNVTPILLQNFSQTIGELTNLQSLDLSNTYFLYDAFLGKGLAGGHSLVSVNLANCWREGENLQDSWQGGIQLIKGLQAHPNLTYLDLSYSPIGVWEKGGVEGSGPNSTITLANALQSWPNLQSLNLAESGIGYDNETSALYFLDKLSELATAVHENGGILEANLNVISANISWTQGAEVFQSLTQQQIQNACEVELCTGISLNSSNPKIHTTRNSGTRRGEREPMTSAASRPTSLFHRLGNYIGSWFSWNAWSESYDRILDSAVAYAQSVVEDCPSYFTYKTDIIKPSYEGANLNIFNYPLPPIREIGTEEGSLYLLGLNYTQAAVRYPSSAPLLPTYQPLMLGR